MYYNESSNKPCMLYVIYECVNKPWMIDVL